MVFPTSVVTEDYGLRRLSGRAGLTHHGPFRPEFFRTVRGSSVTYGRCSRREIFCAAFGASQDGQIAGTAIA
jgi:hypothetical protein